LSYRWQAAGPVLVLPAATLALWLYFVRWPGRQPLDWLIAETCLVLGLLLLFGTIVGPAQYAAAALRFPLVDPWLASTDAALGVHVPSLVAWTRKHPWLVQFLFRTYTSLLPQLFLPVIVLGLWYRDRAALWTYAFHFHVCLAVTLVCFAVWPAACAFTYYGFDSIISQQRFIQHFGDARAGLMPVIDPLNIEGLVSFPSFHAAGALMATWALRRSWVWLTILGVINTGLVAATVLTGAHYVTDVLATLVLCAASLVLHRVLGLAPVAAVTRPLARAA
jgi:hypothetical protein